MDTGGEQSAHMTDEILMVNCSAIVRCRRLTQSSGAGKKCSTSYCSWLGILVAYMQTRRSLSPSRATLSACSSVTCKNRAQQTIEDESMHSSCDSIKAAMLVLTVLLRVESRAGNGVHNNPGGVLLLALAFPLPQFPTRKFSRAAGRPVKKEAQLIQFDLSLARKSTCSEGDSVLFTLMFNSSATSRILFVLGSHSFH
jgi:hypothetical protein